MGNGQCPNCGNQEISHTWTVPQHKGKFEIHWCKTCGFGWQSPYPSKSALNEYYRQQELYHDAIVNENQGGFRPRVQKLNELLPNKGRLLDIGAGLGHFLYLARKSGWEVEGIEPRKKAAEYCWQNFGIKLHETPFQEWEHISQYDVVTLWDVLEHVHDPIRLFARCVDFLSPGGILVISIPNSSGLLARVFKGKWRYTMVPHINYFTMRFIDDLTKQNHLSIERADHTVKAQSIFEGLISILPARIDVENVYRKTYTGGVSIGRSSDEGTADRMKKLFRKGVYALNTTRLPLPIGDIVDLYCKKQPV